MPDSVKPIGQRWQDGALQWLVPQDDAIDGAEGLEARVKDPLWFMARQWQVGEFEGESGGRPVKSQVVGTCVPMARITRVADDGSSESCTISPSHPLEKSFEDEQEASADPLDAARLQWRHWNAAALSFRGELSGGGFTLVAGDYDGVDLDWHDFEIREVGDDSAKSESLPPETPGPVRIRGMPDQRWWTFEDGRIDLTMLLGPQPNMLSLFAAEFLFLDSDNWFLTSLPTRPGEIRRIQELKIWDSFGYLTTLHPIDEGENVTGWKLFTLNPEPGREVDPRGLFFVPNVSGTVVQGDIVEEVLFLRDEAANLIFAVERYYTEDGLCRNREDEEARRESAPPDTATAGLPPDVADLPVYQLRSPIARHWIPYVPHSRDIANTEIYLRRGRSVENLSAGETQYKSRLLAESWKLYEEVIPRTGLRVQRLWRQAWDTDGNPHVWIGRRTEIGATGASAGLDYDFLIGRK